MRNVFAAPLHLISALLQKFPTARDLNLASKKRKWGNHVWDTAICYTIGRFHQLDGAAVLLVTGDRAIREAAVAANCARSVMSLDDYLVALAASPSAKLRFVQRQGARNANLNIAAPQLRSVIDSPA